MKPGLKLVGRVLTALAFALMAGAFQVPDSTPGSPRAFVGLLAGILGALGPILTLYGDGEPIPVPP